LILEKLGNYTEGPFGSDRVLTIGPFHLSAESQDLYMVWRCMACLLVVLWGFGSAPDASAQEQPARPLAPGVLTVIEPDIQHEETFSGPLELVEIVQGLPTMDWQPNYDAKSRTAFERAKLVTLRRQIWNLEFAFKPMRTLEVDVPQAASGKMQKKLIWYMVYRVRYLGNDLVPDPIQDKYGHTTFGAKPVAQEARYFFPQFLLESHDPSKTYQDRIIPAAYKLIEEREGRGKTLLNSVDMGVHPIPLSTPENPQEVWGVATWEDIDPRMDYFSVFVKGLTNAYKPIDPPGAFKAGDAPGTGRELLAKALRLNFWRPGDAIKEQEDAIYFGVPFAADPERQAQILRAYGLKERVDYSWVYR
jgi:hypothetical protein